MTQPLLLQVRGLHAGYGTGDILRGVDLDIRRGETVGLLGRNGMGKSTLIRAVLGHVRERRGKVLLDGHDVSRSEPHQVARLGVAYVPEGRGVFPNLTVRENLLVAALEPGRDGTGWSLDRVLATFPRLAERLRHPGGLLSGGEQQMLALGRALLTQPQLLLLDEATEGLAPLVVNEIWRVVTEVRASGVAALIVDRDWRRVLRHADRGVVLVKGQVVAQGPAQRLLEQPDVPSHLGL